METSVPPLNPLEQMDRRNALSEERTKLAAERTFLAWLRTGLTSIGIGIAIARFIIFRQIQHQQMGHLIGQLLILWGICVFIFALVSYHRSVSRFNSSSNQVPFKGLIIVTVFLIILSFLLFWIVVE